MQRTTIQLDVETREMLERLKRQRKAHSYAQVIRELIKATGKVRGEKGSLPKLKAFRREKTDRFD